MKNFFEINRALAAKKHFFHSFILSLFMSAIVLGMASCGDGNEPEQKISGKFTVNNEGKQVYFAKGNVKQTSDGKYSFFDNQWEYTGERDHFPKDLFNWDATEGAVKDRNNWRVLTRNEWWYLFRLRDNAEKLFAHATITIDEKDIHGLIILPDNWQTPDGIDLKTAEQMGFDWNSGDDKYIHPETAFDGYGKNKYDLNKWKTLESAGAVFLPATYQLNNFGWYWSSTDIGNGAFEFSWSTSTLNLMCLKIDQTKKDYASIRLVQDVE